MKKRIRTNRMHSRILVSALIVLVGLGIGISCSKDTGVSSDPRLRASKPALPSSKFSDLHSQTFDDPLNGMNLDERKETIGGRASAEKFLQVVVRHLAIAMNDDEARKILHQNASNPDAGAVHLSTLFSEHPELLSTLSGDFKDAISDKVIAGELAKIIQESESDSEAILKAVKALFELEIRLVTPEGDAWEESEKIPVFYTPLDDVKATVVEGVDMNLMPISFPVPKDKQTAPYSFLLINFDEDLLPVYKDIAARQVHKHESFWAKFINAIGLTPSAHAHFDAKYWDDTDHDDCYHTNILQPVKRIHITDRSELFGDEPEIYIRIQWTPPFEPHHPDRPRYYEEDLYEVNDPYTYYYRYGYLRTPHGTCGDVGIDLLLVMEEDYYNPHDTMLRKHNVNIPFGGFVPNQADFSGSKASLRMRRTDDDAF